MKVVFLDFDGVINTVETRRRADDIGQYLAPNGTRLSIPVHPPAVACLNRLLAETGAKVVISSSWRLFTGYECLGEALAQHGVVAEVIGQTPDVVNDADWLARNRWANDAYEKIERGHEIREWLRTTMFDVEQFVILDDCCDMADARGLLVHVDPIDGLTDPDVERAKFLLPRSESYLDDLAWSNRPLRRTT